MKKIYNVMASAAVIASLAVPVSAFASSSYTTPTGVATTDANQWINTSSTTRVAVNIDGGSLQNGVTSSVYLRLPSDAYTTFGGTVNPDGSITLPAANVPTNNAANALNAVSSTVTLYPVGTAKAYTNAGVTTNTYNEWKLDVTGSANFQNAGLFYLDLSKTYAPSNTNGTLGLTFDAPTGSPFTNGSVTVAQIGSGKVDVSIDNVNSVTAGSSKAIGTIRIKESQAGSLASATSDNALKLKLPEGFTWNLPTGANVSKVWGDNNNLPTSAQFSVSSSDQRTLYIKGTGTASLQALYYELTGLTINVDDTVAKTGDIDVTVGGDSTYAESDLVVGHYGDYSTAVSIANPSNVQAGQTDEGLNDDSLTITESAPESLVANRTIKLTLGGNAKWNSTDLPVIDSAASDLQGLKLSSFTPVGTDGTTIQATVQTASTGTKGAKIVFKKGGLDLAADAGNQAVDLTVGGTAGVTGEGTIANIVSPVKGSVDGTAPNVKIGVQDQVLAPIVITEAKSGAIDNGSVNKTVYLTFPSGVTVKNIPNITVTDGDLVLANAANITASGNQVTFQIKSTSTKASTIKVDGLKVDVDRTVAEGALDVKVGGSALVESTSQFPNVDKVVEFPVANVVTPAPGETTANATFTIGSTTYTVNGQTKTLDVAPYTEGGRTYLPIRFVAEALGVSDDNIIWNDATKTVTLINGNRIATFKVGQRSYTVNGAVVPMDAAAEFKQNRNMIPLRYAAQALGVAIGWDDATQTVTVGSAAQVGS